MSDETLADVAKKETARQTVILAFSVVGALAMMYVMRKANEPDAFRTFKMGSALKVKRFAQKRADWWQDVADKAATAYQRERD